MKPACFDRYVTPKIAKFVASGFTPRSGIPSRDRFRILPFWDKPGPYTATCEFVGARPDLSHLKHHRSSIILTISLHRFGYQHLSGRAFKVWRWITNDPLHSSVKQPFDQAIGAN